MVSHLSVEQSGEELPLAYEWSYGTLNTDEDGMASYPIKDSLHIVSHDPELKYAFRELGTFGLRLRVDNGETIRYKYFVLQVDTEFSEGITILSRDGDGKGRISFMRTLTKEEINTGKVPVFRTDIMELINPGTKMEDVTDMVQVNNRLLVCSGDAGRIYNMDSRTFDIEGMTSFKELYPGCAFVKFAGVSANNNIYLVSRDRRGYVYDYVLDELMLTEYFKDLDEHWNTMSGLFDEHKWDIEDIFNWACENTVKIAKGAEARYEIERNFMPQYDMADNEKSKYANRHEMFLDLLEDGFNKLVPKDKEDIYRKQLDHEIYVLESTNNVDYMLVQYDTVNWARKNGILVGCGRGSAGGCLVLYLLGITLIDPIKYDLLFERFLLPERAGLYPSDVTIIGDDVDSNQYIEVTLENHKTYKIDKDAQLLVKRAGMDDPIVVYADELQTDDDIQFDNRDLLFTLNEI